MDSKDQVYGIRAVLEALDSGKELNKVFVQKGLRGTLFRELEDALRAKGIPMSFVPIQKLNRLTKNNHQGVVAQISPVAFHDLETLVEKALEQKKPPLFLILDHISDVRNFGAIIRTAECTGVDGIIIPTTSAAPVTADTIKTSAGAAFRVPIAKVSHIRDAVYHLQASGIKVIGATEKAENSLYTTSFLEPCAILMGAEDTGISPSVLKSMDAKVKLPLLGDIRSLNVSVACGVVLYEVVRQRYYGP